MIKYFLNNVFPIYKNVNCVLSEKQKKKLQKETRERYQNISEEKKEKLQFAPERDQNPE